MHTGKKMTMRERMLAILGRSVPDEVPFVQYDGAAAPNAEIWERIGRGNMGILRWSKLHEHVYNNISFAEEDIVWKNLPGKRKTIITPKGALTKEVVYEPALKTEFIIKHYIKSLSDYEILRSYLMNVEVVPNLDKYGRDDAELGDDGIPMATLSRTAYQQLWIQWVSLADLSYHLADDPGIVEECIALFNDIQRKEFEVVRDASVKIPVYLVNFPDNVTAPAIGVKNFRKYCMPMYEELIDMLSPDIPVVAHMDGDLLPLSGAIAESRIGGVDSLSPPPDNDTSVSAGLSMWPDKRLLVNFPSSVHLAAPEIIYEQAKRLLDEGSASGRMWIQISENVPPGLWKTSYPQIVNAIKNYGRL